MTSLRLCLIVLIGFVAGEAAETRPNIVLIVADDLGFSDIGPYGGEIRTPHLDRLAREGTRFTQFYNCGTGIMTRAALYTGRHPRLGSGGSMKGLLRQDAVTLAELLQERGYATTLVGKWQLGTSAPNRPNDRGFAEFYGGLDGLSDHFNPAKPDPKFHGGKVRPFAHNARIIETFPAGFYSTDAFTDHAIGSIRQAAKARQPFFLNVCYTAPHYPLQAPAEDIARYREKYSAGYDAVRERRFQRQVELGLFRPNTAKLSPAALDQLYDYEFTPWKRLDDISRARQEGRMEAYAAMVDRMDQGIGRLLATLDETGVAENTIVFFLSDNGGNAHFPIRNDTIAPRLERLPIIAMNAGIPVGDPRGFDFVGAAWGWTQNAPFRRYKAWTYEGGICSPLIVRWPGHAKSGEITATTSHVIDLLPTLLEVASGDLARMAPGDKGWEGRSLVPVLRGGVPAERTLPLGWELHGSRALRDGEWKLLWDAGEKVWELYDLSVDRAETVDLAAKHPDRVETMADAWSKWARLTDAPIR